METSPVIGVNFHQRASYVFLFYANLRKVLNVKSKGRPIEISWRLVGVTIIARPRRVTLYLTRYISTFPFTPKVTNVSVPQWISFTKVIVRRVGDLPQKLLMCKGIPTDQIRCCDWQSSVHPKCIYIHDTCIWYLVQENIIPNRPHHDIFVKDLILLQFHTRMTISFM